MILLPLRSTLFPYTTLFRSVFFGAILIFVLLWLFFNKTLLGRAVLATANNRIAALLVGVNTNYVMTLSFAVSAAIGALAGVLVTPITLTSFDIGMTMALDRKSTRLNSSHVAIS